MAPKKLNESPLSERDQAFLAARDTLLEAMEEVSKQLGQWKGANIHDTRWMTESAAEAALEIFNPDRNKQHEDAFFSRMNEVERKRIEEAGCAEQRHQEYLDYSSS